MQTLDCLINIAYFTKKKENEKSRLHKKKKKVYDTCIYNVEWTVVVLI